MLKMYIVAPELPSYLIKHNNNNNDNNNHNHKNNNKLALVKCHKQSNF